MVQALNNSNLNTINNSDKLAVIDFSAMWCNPCKQLEPVYEELSNEIEEADFYKVDIDAEQELAGKFNIISVPTIVLIKNGQELSRISGFQGKEFLKGKLLSNI